MNSPLWRRVALAIGLSAVVIIACSKGGGVDEDDGNSPYSIIDLAVTAVSDTSAKLVWTATGDDSNEGTASSYDMRYARAWIGDSVAWDSAIQVTGEPHPSPGGQKDSMTIYGLMKDSAFFFMVHICDEAGNCASSGCTGAICFTDYVVTFPDTSLEAAVRVQVGKPTGDIMRSDLANYSLLDANDRHIVSLSGMEHWKNLEGLLLGQNRVIDLTPLAGLIRLRGLGLTGNGLWELGPIAGLTNLEVLHIRTNPIKNITALQGMMKLNQLDMTQDSVSDLSALVNNAGFAGGDTVWLGENPLSATALNTQIPALQARGVTVLGL